MAKYGKRDPRNRKANKHKRITLDEWKPRSVRKRVFNGKNVHP